MPPTNDQSPYAKAGKRLRILIVDDEEELLQPMEAILRQQGYEVRTAPNGLKALDFLRSLHRGEFELPDLLVTDLAMPALDGLGLLSAMQAEGLRIDGILAISGHGSRDNLKALMRHGAADFMDKPFSLHDLLARVSRIAENIQQSRQMEISRLQKLEADNRVLRERMRKFETRETLARLTQGILHDMHNCLAIITGSAEMIKMALASGNRPVDGYAESIADLTQRAVKTLRQLDALNRMGEGIWTCFDLHELLDGTLDLVRTALGGKFRLRPQYLPDPALVSGDAVLLQSLFIQTLLAIRDSLGPEGGELQMSTHLRLDDFEMDNCEGWVMVRFMAVGDSKDGPISLKKWDSAPVREALKSLGGQLRIDSGMDWGAAVTVELPAAALPIHMSKSLIEASAG